jgi:hypothetical protein
MKKIFKKILDDFSIKFPGGQTWGTIALIISIVAGISTILINYSKIIQFGIDLFMESNTKNEEGWSTYNAPNGLYTIKYPPTWIPEEIEDPLDGTFLKLVPLDKKGNKVNATLSFLTRDLRENPLSLEAHKDDAVRRFGGDSKFISEDETTFANRPAYQLVYSKVEDGTKFKVLYIASLDHNKAYILTYQAPKHLYNDYEQDALKISRFFKKKVE